MDHIISYNVEHIIVISLPERSIGAIFLTHLRSRPAASLGIGLQETTCWKMSPHWYLGTTKRRGSAERVCQGGASHLVNDVNGLYHVVPPVNPSYIYILYYIYIYIYVGEFCLYRIYFYMDRPRIRFVGCTSKRVFVRGVPHILNDVSIYYGHANHKWYMAVCQNLVPMVNIKIAGKWMFIPLKMVLIGIDPYPYIYIYIGM